MAAAQRWASNYAIALTQNNNLKPVDNVSQKSHQRFLCTMDDDDSLAKIYQEKSVVRQVVKEKLNALSEDQKATQSKIVREKLYAHDIYQKSNRVSVFLNMSDEIQTLDILKKLFTDGKSVFIPRYSTKLGKMDMVRIASWEDYENLPTTKWNIKQPSVNDPREDALDTGGLDLVIMPGLAFTKSGRRLGRGKGYYDAFLRRCQDIQKTKPSTIAVAFNEQILPDIPITPKDVIIDEVLHADG